MFLHQEVLDEVGEVEDVKDNMLHTSIAEGLGDDLACSMLLPTVEPAQWREETERVGPLLAQAKKANATGSSDLWGDHVSTMRSFANTWMLRDDDDTNGADGSVTKSGTKEKDKDRNDLAAVAQQLEVAGRGIGDNLKSIGRGEDALVRAHGFGGMCGEFSEHKKVNSASPTK